ncbi:MAG: SPOR domain-containing protein [Treponema sp.]|jgi:hypothetical protein|nr:SPOR domain-containing protein [Treponema sp.]
MKNSAFFGFVIVSALFCVSASVWEGAASVSLNGELPEEGYYVATRSFPRNTIVDVTNLETGQTIRAIVASGLDSPGLLAILSKDAAGAIGLHARFVGRIRMTMPSEPVAFSRFTDEVDSSGDPDFDPAAAIAAAKDSGFDVEQAVDAIEKDPVKANDPGSSADNAASSNPTPIAPNPAASDIVDLPESYTPPQTKTKDGSVTNEPAPVPARPADTATAAGVYGYTPEPAISSDTSDAARVYPPKYMPETSEPEPAEAAAQTVPPETASGAPAAITLIPAEQRPPESSSYQGLPPEAEIAPLEGSGAEYTVQSNIIPDEYVIPPIDSRPPSAAAVQAEPVIDPVIPPIERAVSERAVSSPPEVIIEVAVVEANPLSANVPAAGEKEEPWIPAVPETERPAGFSVPVISSLERGKYYLQLAAYTLRELVETELLKISTVYPLAVQEGGSAGKPLYRILIGPVNLGESGALLQRFKVSGYRDAFIRKEGE